MTDSSGTIQARYSYDAYGRQTKVSGSLDSTFQFTGDYYHATSGLNLTKYRAYDPNTARWLSRDPFGTTNQMRFNPKTGVPRIRLGKAEMLIGPNLYEYCNNQPINEIDRLGLAGYYHSQVRVLSEVPYPGSSKAGGCPYVWVCDIQGIGNGSGSRAEEAQLDFLAGVLVAGMQAAAVAGDAEDFNSLCQQLDTAYRHHY